MQKLTWRWLSVFLACLALAGLGVVALATSGCGGDDEECLSWGENCTQQYLEDNYGTTDIQCCEGQCADHGSGILTCGS